MLINNSDRYQINIDLTLRETTDSKCCVRDLVYVLNSNNNNIDEIVAENKNNRKTFPTEKKNWHPCKNIRRRESALRRNWRDKLRQPKCLDGCDSWRLLDFASRRQTLPEPGKSRGRYARLSPTPSIGLDAKHAHCLHNDSASAAEFSSFVCKLISLGSSGKFRT